MADAYTISVSNDMHAEAHSRREYTPFSADRSLKKDNIVVYDCGDDRKHFGDFFRPIVEEYNAKQKREDRKKDTDYLSALEDGREGYGKGKAKEKPFYHDVIQIGNRNTNGVTDSSFDVDHWRQLKKDKKFDEASEYVQKHLNTSQDVQDMIVILQELAEEIKTNRDGKYTGVLVHGLTIHCDEPNGTPHLDFRYSLYCTGEKTGLSSRISMRKALGNLGFYTDKEQTALEKFRNQIKDRLEEKMKERGYQRDVKGEHRKHLSTASYEAEARAKEAEERLAKAQEDLREAEDDIEDLRAEASLLQKQKSEAEAKITEAKKRDADLTVRETQVVTDEAEIKRKKKVQEDKDEAQKIKDAEQKKTDETLKKREKKASDDRQDAINLLFAVLRKVAPDGKKKFQTLGELQAEAQAAFQVWEDGFEAQKEAQKKIEGLTERVASWFEWTPEEQKKWDAADLNGKWEMIKDSISDQLDEMEDERSELEEDRQKAKDALRAFRMAENIQKTVAEDSVPYSLMQYLQKKTYHIVGTTVEQRFKKDMSGSEWITVPKKDKNGKVVWEDHNPLQDYQTYLKGQQRRRGLTDAEQQAMNEAEKYAPDFS